MGFESCLHLIDDFFEEWHEMVKVFFLVGVEDDAPGVVGEVGHDVTYLWGAECVFCLSLELWFLHVEGNDGDES